MELDTITCISIVTHCVLVLIAFMSIIFYKTNDYVHIGPRNNLTLVNFPVHTNDMYIFVITFLSLLRFTHISINRIGKLYFESVRRTHNNDVPLIRAIVLSNMTHYVDALSFLILVKAYMTQLGFAILPIIISEILFWPLNSYYMKLNNRYNKPYPKEVLDVTTINPMFTQPKLVFDNVYEDTESN
jgi:hypothetical protein